jgi:1-aminocyclopropane-1-carboxylate deaminase
MLKYEKTPVIKFENDSTDRNKVTLLIKREDLNHPTVSGNKWWKLKYNLEEAKKRNYKTLLTFGGAYSNHIYATAAAAEAEGFKSIGIIRGEHALPLSPTLKFAQNRHMELHWISREKYRAKNTESFINELTDRFGPFYLIPEGGTNSLALKGCEEFAHELQKEISFDHLFLPVGTGGTMAGIICGLGGTSMVTGVSVLKNGEFLAGDVQKLSRDYSGKDYGNWHMLTSYDHGGYAKVTPELSEFIVMMRVQHNLLLDHVYTAKLFWAVLKEIETGKFPENSTILAIHTGGLQGAQH